MTSIGNKRKRLESSNCSSHVTGHHYYSETVEDHSSYTDHQTGKLENKQMENKFQDKEDNVYYQPSPSIAIPGQLEPQPEANNNSFPAYNSFPETMPDNPISADNQTTPSYTIESYGMESHPRDKPAMKGRGLVPKRLNFSDEVIKVSFDGKDGEYVLKLTTGDKKENAMEEQAQAAAMLLSQAAMLRRLGETLLSNLEAQFEPQFFNSLKMKEPTE